jgi:YHS domain-containing protein
MPQLISGLKVWHCFTRMSCTGSFRAWVPHRTDESSIDTYRVQIERSNVKTRWSGKDNDRRARPTAALTLAANMETAMSGLVSFLIFAAVFFFMMRFGCGAHIGHGGHHGGHRDHDGDASPNSTDPVCGMHVDAGNGYAKTLRGIQYRFCSRDCLDKFDAAPDKYLGQQPQATGHGGNSA